MVEKFSYTTKIELPSGLEEIISILVALEAEKIIPFPLEEVVWDYHLSPLLEEKKPQETFEVTYRVAKKESLEAAYHEALAAGVATESLFSDHDLLPPSLIAARLESQKQRHWERVSMLLLFFLTSCFFYLHHETASTKAANTQAALLLHQEKKSLAASKEILATARKLKKEGAFLVTLTQERAAWPELLHELDETIPSHCWITKLSAVLEDLPTKTKVAQQTTVLCIEGLSLETAPQAPLLNEWLNNLRTSPFFALQEKKNEELITLHSVADNTAYAYPFKLMLPVFVR